MLVISTANLYFNDPNLAPDTIYTYKIYALHSGATFAYAITSARTLKKCDETLTSVGLSSHAIVSLSQLISYVNFQSRVLAGLRALKGAA